MNFSGSDQWQVISLPGSRAEFADLPGVFASDRSGCIPGAVIRIDGRWYKRVM
ncbi:MAG: hypothetical protein JXL20_08165 [Deltaproteobacteria bacterium]|nr:hypothetical protein [Deltaproteobacteria bacterium]